MTKTRAKKAQESAVEMTETSNKMDTLLAKMDDLLKAKDKQEEQLNEIMRKLDGTIQEVEDLKKSLNFYEESLNETKKVIAEKATKEEIDQLRCKVDDLENRSKRNNLVLFNVPEGSEEDWSSQSCEEFVENFFHHHMGLVRIEVMRAHRTPTFERGASRRDRKKPRPIHAYLLRYTDKENVLKNAARLLKDKKYKESQIFISDDVSKKVRGEREELRRNHLPAFKAKEEVEFAFIPWSIPAKILYKVSGHDGLKSFVKQ